MTDNDKKELLGALIKNARAKKGLSQDKLSSLIEIDPRNLSRIEKGKSYPSFGTFCKMIEILEIEPNHFLNFIKFSATKNSEIDLKLIAIINTLSDESKIKLFEFIKTIK